MNKINKLLGIGALSFALVACTTNPITGRSSLQLANNQEISAMALQQYRETLSQSKVITGTTAAKSVQNVGLRIKNAANNYYRSIGREGDLANYQWEFNLLDDKQINAWCMPGGKVAVYTGILPITKNDTGLAVVLGHEISHALAGHGNERISQAMVAQYGGAILGSTISSGQMAAIFQQVYPIGAQVALLKYGRNQELEADEMGLYLMSMAGYDPREAQPFWQRMEAASTGNRPPEFLSTHPSPSNRRADLEKHMPKALEYYRASGGKI
ncbi:M48 family metallopeptidase [Kaistella palustris]|uniref:M48 family metallopeptidase n=1 Tax=Kaistella palustris TaxID=493376 RepID=UPI0004206B8C|nr:M48 family metallopeptidase [Kaistella palustris]